MKKLSLLPLLALVIAVSASAFTVIQDRTSDLVWFKIDPDTQAIISDGSQGDVPPPAMSCQSTGRLCAAAFSIDAEQVYEENGTYHLAEDVTLDDRLDDRKEP